MKKFIVRNLKLPGSWSWACLQMSAGKIVRPGNVTGAVRYKIDEEFQGRIIWAFTQTPAKNDWENANIFLNDFRRTDWVIA